jgi:hypothetical protein
MMRLVGEGEIFSAPSEKFTKLSSEHEAVDCEGVGGEDGRPDDEVPVTKPRPWRARLRR